MSICIPSIKTDVYREGNKAIIARTGKVTCPVNESWSLDMSAAKMYINSSDLLITLLTFRKNSNSYVLGYKGISYSRRREIFLDALAALGYDSKPFGLQS